MRRFLLAAMLVAISGAAIAQSMGLGLGLHDLRRIKAGPPAAASALLVNTGSKMLANTGVAILAHN